MSKSEAREIAVYISEIGIELPSISSALWEYQYAQYNEELWVDLAIKTRELEVLVEKLNKFLG